MMPMMKIIKEDNLKSYIEQSLSEYETTENIDILMVQESQAIDQIMNKIKQIF